MKLQTLFFYKTIKQETWIKEIFNKTYDSPFYNECGDEKR